MSHEGNATWQVKTYPPDTFSCVLGGLNRDLDHTVRVAAFTSKGAGNATEDLIRPDRIGIIFDTVTTFIAICTIATAIQGCYWWGKSQGIFFLVRETQNSCLKLRKSKKILLLG